MKGYEILSLGDMEPVPYHAREGQKLLPVERTLRYRATGVNGWIGDPGEGLVPLHREDTDEELYVVVRGRAAFTVEGREIDAPAGTLVHVLPGEERTAVSQEPGTIVLAVGATAGKPYEPGGWTDWAVADGLRRQGRVVEGRAEIDGMVAERPNVWFVSYNAACYEALAGETDRAFEHLERARRLDPAGVRGVAGEDPDLESLRGDPRWQEIAG